ncbi:MAG: gliding motility-associated C-terminal domain-containing protein [Bacteroidales bacterium]|nr:gliding motility-associated C-terminal domain-containing protein [Bacteroidales bacterium]
MAWIMSYGIRAQAIVVGHPADTAICVDASANFRVVALNTAAYQWQENDGVGWYNINESIDYASGYNTPLLTISDANLGLNGYQYRCMVFDAEALQDVSEPASLGVYEPPILTAHPADTRVCKNETAVFAVQAINGTAFSWQENIGQGWVHLQDNAFYQGTNTNILEVFTTTGMNGFRYRCIVNNVSCPDTSVNARLFVDPTPVVQQITGGGSYCSEDTGVEIGLADSETGISYQLLRNENQTGNVIEGNNEAISFGSVTQEGQYSVLAINGFTSCSILMEGVTDVTINPLPLQQQLGGGGSYCPGEEAPEIFLLETEPGVVYQLFANGAFTGAEIIGNGYISSFGRFASSGIYTVTAANQSTGCFTQITSQVQITEENAPNVFAGSNQFIQRGEIASLNASATGGSGNYSYNWNPQAYVQQPDWSSTQTIPLFQSRQFIINATDNQNGCKAIPDTMIVYITDGQLELELVASQTQICPGDQVQLSAIAGGGTGNYSYQWTSLPEGIHSTNAQIVVSPVISTTYIVTLNDGQQTIQKSVSIQVNPVPAQFSITGDESYCANEAGVEIGLNGSENGAIYQLIRNDNVVVAEKPGTGQAIEFGTYGTGNYHIKVQLSSGNCSQIMNGYLSVSMISPPVLTAGANQYISSGNQTTLSSVVQGGSGNYQFSWTPLNKLINPNQQNPATLALFETTLFEVTTTDMNTGCYSNAAQTVVFVTGGEIGLTLQADQYSICSGESVQLQALPTGGSGNYVYQWQSNPPGVNALISNPLVTLTNSSWLILTLTDGFTVLSDSLFIEVRPLPQAFTLDGGGSYCAGSQGVDVILTGSENDVFYTLYRNGTNTGQVRIGNGQPITFADQTIEGIYQIDALSQQQLCNKMMPGNVEVIARNTPIGFAGYDRTIQMGTTTNLNAEVSQGSGSYTFEWSPESMVENPDLQQTLTAPLSQNTIFNLSVTDNQSGCQSQTDQVQVFVQGSTLQVTASANQQLVCQGSNVDLHALATGGTANYYYSWTSVPAGFYSGEVQPVVTPTASAWYKVTVYDGQQTASDSIFISVSQPPQTFTVFGGGQICETDQIQQVILDGSESGIHYRLFYEDILMLELFGTGSVLQFGGYDQPGSYTVMAVNAEGCQKMMNGEAFILQATAPLINAGPDKWIGQNEQVTLEGSLIGDPATTFNWNPAAQLLNPDAIQPTTTPLVNTTLFALQASNPACGSSTDYATVFVTGGSLTLSLYHTPVSCPGEAVYLFALPGGGIGDYTYSWTSNPTGFESATINPVVYPLEATWYIFYLTENEQTLKDSVLISPLDQPKLFDVLGGGQACNGFDLPQIQLSGSETGVVYTLLHNGFETDYSLSGNGFALYFEAVEGSGNYQINASYALSKCTSLMNGTAEIEISALPAVFAGSDQIIQIGESAALNMEAVGGSGEYSYQWYPDWLVEFPESAYTTTTALDQTTVYFASATDLLSECISEQDTVIIFVEGGPLRARILTNQSQLCEGQIFKALALPSGGSGTYTFRWTNTENEVLGNEAQLAVDLFQNSWIFLSVSDGENTTTDSVYVAVASEIMQFALTGGGYYCVGSEAPDVGLSGSEIGVQYELFRGGQLLFTAQGTGTTISFGQQGMTGIYTVEAYRSGFPCRKAMAGAAVIVRNRIPQLNAGEDIFIPRGTSANLQAVVSDGSGDYALQWQPESLVTNPDAAATATLPLQQSVFFEVFVTDNLTLCQASDQLSVFVTGGILSVSLHANAAFVCPGKPLQINALPSGGEGNYISQWFINGQLLPNSAWQLVDYPTEDTWYKIVVESGDQQAKDSVLVRMNSLPQVFTLDGGGLFCDSQLPPDVYLNDSETTVAYKLYLNGLFTGLTKNGTGNTLHFGPRFAQGNYHVLAQSQENCVQLMDGLVEVKQTAKARQYDLLGGGRWCDNESGNGLYLSGSEAGVDYTLLNEGETPIEMIYGTGSAIGFGSPSVTGAYRVVAGFYNESCAQPMRGFVSAVIDPSPQLHIAGETTACENDAFILSASGADAYEWLLDPVLTSDQITLPAVENMEFLVTGTNSLGCMDSATIQLQVNPRPQIELILNAEERSVTVQPDTFLEYTFSSGSMLLQSGASGSFTYAGIDLPVDTVAVQAITAEGCVSEAAIFVETNNESNAFSPNGDGINDVFRKGDFIRVFSRWGVELFGGDEGWDGRYKGSMVAPGTYYFLQEIRDANGVLIRTEKGSVTLVIE